MVFIHAFASMMLILGAAAIPAPVPQIDITSVSDGILSSADIDLLLSLDTSVYSFSSVTDPSILPTEIPASSDIQSTSSASLDSPKTTKKPAVPPGPPPRLTCDTVLCRDGYVCRDVDGRPGCYDKNLCGNVYCEYGTRCCNFSCSKCAPPDVFCTQEACVTEPAKGPAVSETMLM
ncbi:hypothetical protein LX36DRAFT_653444 [Colletotrichum falcatum]|nr:hypothetical protein LX36DRAFT_653444 [Colletotrichum falcatum]